MSAWFSTVASEPRLRLHVTTEGCEVCWPIEARACDTWEVGVTESREESRRHYLRHAAGSPRPPAQSVLCVRDGWCAAGPEAPAGVRGAGSPLGSPRRAHHWAHHKRTCGLTTMGSPLSSFSAAGLTARAHRWALFEGIRTLRRPDVPSRSSALAQVGHPASATSQPCAGRCDSA